jgi:hypothetical protein
MYKYILLILAFSFSFCKQNENKPDLDITKQSTIKQQTINAFAHFVDSLKIYDDSSFQSISNKLKIINSKYGQNRGIEIVERLKGLNERAFDNAIEAINSENDSFFIDNRFDLKRREERFIQLISVAAHQGDFKRFLMLEQTYYPLFHESKIKDERVASTVQGVNRYNKYADSLDRQNLALDEKAFLKAKALQDVCGTGLFEAEACYNFELMHNAFKALIKNYPNSKFANQADFLLFDASFCDEGGADSEALKERLKDYKIYLKKYKNADFEVDIQLAIYYTLSAMEGEDTTYKNALKKQGQLLIAKFPNHENILSIKERIKYL